MLDKRDFSDSVQLELAIADIRRYQRAYMQANKVKGIMVKWKKGWFAICHSRSGVVFYRTTEFHNMTDILEKRVAPTISSRKEWSDD